MPEDLLQISSEEGAAETRWLSKRFEGANGSHVRWADENSGAGEREERRYLQEFVQGQIESASFVAYEGGLAFLGACRQIVGAQELGASAFGFAGAVGPLISQYRNASFFQRLGDAIARMADVRGFVGIDGVRRADGAWLPIEINPRYAASIETFDTSPHLPLFDVHARACSRRPAPAISSGPQGCLAKGILYAKQELSLSFDLPAWRRFESAFADVRLADLPRPGTISRPGDPILTLLVAGIDVDETQASLLAIAPHVHHELVRRFGR